MEEYKIYQNSLGNIPEFLEKYLSLDIMNRLKGISLLCGMEYASVSAYDFKFYISRYDHSLNVALITWKLTHDKASTLAALFHDVASPVFSHVIDYMNHDYVNQESTEEKTEEILLNDYQLRKYLEEDEIRIDEVINFKEYSVVDLDRPKMCADRLENIISVGMNWVNQVDGILASLIIEDMYLYENEEKETEIGFKTPCIADYVKQVNDRLNDLTHTNEDTYMMMLLARIIRLCLELNLFTYDDLYTLTESEIVDIIENNLDIDYELSNMWDLFRNIKNIPYIKQPPIKNKIVNPLVKGKRLNR